ncbi:MAG: hypothetical protein ACRD19_05245 [Terriglobia bacterium]
MKNKLPIALLLVLPALAKDIPKKPQAPPSVPVEMQLAAQKEISQSLSLELQMEQARNEYQGLVAKMQRACSSTSTGKAFVLRHTKSGDWVCVATPLREPARPSSAAAPLKKQ